MIAKDLFDCGYVLIGPSVIVKVAGKRIYLTITTWSPSASSSSSFFFFFNFPLFDVIDQWEDWIRRNEIHCLSPDKMNIPHTSRENLKIIDCWPQCAVAQLIPIFINNCQGGVMSYFQYYTFRTWPGVIRVVTKLYGKNRCCFSILNIPLLYLGLNFFWA